MRARRGAPALALGLVLAATLLAGCARPVDCESAEFDFVAEPDLLFRGTVSSTTPERARFVVDAAVVGEVGRTVDVAYDDPGLLIPTERYEVRAERVGTGFRSAPFCGATLLADGSRVDTSWLATWRARLPSTPLALVVSAALFAAVVAAGLAAIRRIDRRARERERA